VPAWAEPPGRFTPLVILTLRANSSLAAENLFLRKQLAFYQERRIKPRRTSDQARLSLLWLSRWFDWRSALAVVTPNTFIGWHRRGFQFYWRRKCQAGRPPIPPDLQLLIRTMARENPSWGEERIANELRLKLGLRVSARTIRKYLLNVPARPVPSQNLVQAREARIQLRQRRREGGLDNRPEDFDAIRRGPNLPTSAPMATSAHHAVDCASIQ
jgi:hypothetical protein